jgi:hypothetical protein
MCHEYNTIEFPDTPPTAPESVQRALSCVAAPSCPHCGKLLSLFEPTAHALVDHFLLIESEMAQLRRLLLEEIGL